MNREQWLEQRRSCIGSSDMPILWLGEHYGKDASALWRNKMGLEPREELTGDDIERGNTYEPIALAKIAERWGGTVHAAADDADKWARFYRRIEGRPLHGNLDGTWIDPEGRAWVLEVKAPRQWRASRMRAEGPEEAWRVQAHFLAGIADACGAPGIAPGQVHGVIVAVYESDTTQVQRWEYPLTSASREWIAEMFLAAEQWWEAHVVANVPPNRAPAHPVPPTPVQKGKDKDRYVPVEGEGWERASRAYELAVQRWKAAEADEERARELLDQAMGIAGLDAVQVGGLKFLLSETKGRVTLDEKLLRAEHPELDWPRYQKQGKASRSFRAYGIADGEDSADLRAALRDWPTQAAALGGEAPAAFEELGARVLRHLDAARAEGDELMQCLLEAKGRTL
jgi:hypothetical protein